ncbi:MAG: NUDIX hydrolase [Hyphomonadaceae bacterium]
MKVPSADAYGGVLINDRGQVQLREPANHFGGYVWTFAKGRPDHGETPEQTALREVLEETGQAARIIALIPGVFAGTTTSTVFFLMEPVGEAGPFSGETAAVRWVDDDAARQLMAMTTTQTGRKRDLQVLEAALAAWRVLR